MEEPKGMSVQINSEFQDQDNINQRKDKEDLKVHLKQHLAIPKEIDFLVEKKLLAQGNMKQETT